MDIPEYTFKEVGYSGSLQDIANILEYPQEQVLFSGDKLRVLRWQCSHCLSATVYQFAGFQQALAQTHGKRFEEAGGRGQVAKVGGAC